MASPFKLFRKHQKLMIATLGLMAMIAFVLLPIILQQMGQSRARQNPPVVTTTAYGDLRESEIRGLFWRRQKVLVFLDRVVGLMYQHGADRRQLETLAQFKGGLGETTEQRVVDDWLLQQRARELGMTVSDQAVKDFLLKDLTQDLVGMDELLTILKNMGLGQHLFADIIRGELLTLRLREMFWVSLQGTTPAQRWDYFTSVERKAKVELATVLVADYVDNVKDPDEAVLREFFDRYKDQLARPDSPEPGFQEPHRIAIQYFKADSSELIDAEAISDEEIEKAYNDNKEQYDQTYRRNREFYDRLGEEEKEEKEGVEGENGETEKKEKKEGAEAEPPKDESDAEPPKDESNDESDAVPDLAPPADSPHDESAAPDEQEEQVPPGQPDAPADESAESGNTSFAPAVSPFRLTAMLQEASDEEKAADQEKVADEEKAPDEEKAAGEEPPADEAGPSGDEPQEPAAGPELSGPENPAAGEAEPSGDLPEEPEAVPVKPEIPEAIKKMVRMDLAEALFRDKVANAFAALQAKMSEYHNQQTLFEAVGGEKPDELDFPTLAKQYGLGSGSTPLISQREAADEAEHLTIARSNVGNVNMTVQELLAQAYVRPNPFLRSAFDESWPEHLAETSWDFRSRYLYWKVDDVEQHVPEFEDAGVKEKVLLAWKMKQARDLAKREAERLAEEARKSGKPLEGLLGGREGIEVTAAEPFSWMTGGDRLPGSAPTPTQISAVEGVDYAGTDFMQTVFGLEAGGIGVAMNLPEKVAYVVRVLEFNPPHSLLWRKFQIDPYYKYRGVALGDQRRMLNEWTEQLAQEAGLKWMPRPKKEPELEE